LPSHLISYSVKDEETTKTDKVLKAVMRAFDKILGKNPELKKTAAKNIQRMAKADRTGTRFSKQDQGQLGGKTKADKKSIS
jgi:hypothetical protein